MGSCGVSTPSNACSGHCGRPGPGLRHTAVCTPVIGNRRRVGVFSSCRILPLLWRVPPLSGSVEVRRLLSLPTSYTPRVPLSVKYATLTHDAIYSVYQKKHRICTDERCTGVFGIHASHIGSECTMSLGCAKYSIQNSTVSMTSTSSTCHLLVDGSVVMQHGLGV